MIATFFSIFSLFAASAAAESERVPCATQAPQKQAFLWGFACPHTLLAGCQYTGDTHHSGAGLPVRAWRAYRHSTVDTGRQAQRSLQLSRPLDFAMVSDHAELIGEVYMCNTPEFEGYNSWQCLIYRHWSRGAYYLFNYMATIEQSHLGQCGDDDELCLRAALQPWQATQQAAEDFYDRSADCEFTTFVGYEWTGMDSSNGGNLHRNVVFRSAEVPRLPASFIDEPAAHLLWDSLQRQL